jgi:hypothetical protein
MLVFTLLPLPYQRTEDEEVNVLKTTTKTKDEDERRKRKTKTKDENGVDRKRTVERRRLIFKTKTCVREGATVGVLSSAILPSYLPPQYSRQSDVGPFRQRSPWKHQTIGKLP